ncbi:YciI family protein [Corynebacterium gerontici]|uniref:YciI family protein n=1 Tax=Corynebacterium gerontici TaxID=2079234 RepID=UPI000F4E6BDB|nr:YciI family protein [Corynebacterium gerontici]
MAEGWAASADGTLSQGPASEASHYLGGFWIIEAEDEQQAKEIAAKAAKACGNTVELRAMMG